MNHNKQKNSKNAVLMHNFPLNIGRACSQERPRAVSPPAPKAVQSVAAGAAQHIRTTTQPPSKKKSKPKRTRSAWPPALILTIGILCIL